MVARSAAGKDLSLGKIHTSLAGGRSIHGSNDGFFLNLVTLVVVDFRHDGRVFMQQSGFG